MSKERPCPECGGVAVSESGRVAVENYRCRRCGHEFAVHVHYIEEPRPLGIAVYKALVQAGSGEMERRKNRIKVRRVFEGRSNFYPAKLDSQIEQGQAVWDIGFYSEREVNELKGVASQIGLAVEFVLC